ncbi:MAG: peptidase domain-containing ABC transporter [Muribaculaceae bacterium]|nr:peptidase domain-containing ABC transporter [Muribaculaceae bacterium]
MKRDTYIQLDSMDCGATCLQIIAKYYGIYFSQQRLRELCHITNNGVSMLGISDAAESVGFRPIGAKLTWEQLKDDAQLPCIVHWNQRHFIVVSKIHERRGKTLIEVYDPAKGRLKYPKEDFLKSWLQIKGESDEKRGAALLLSPKSDFFDQEDDDKKSNSKSVINLLNYLKPYKYQILQIVLAMIVASVISLIFPFLTQSIVDTGIGTKDIGFIIIILIAQLGLVAGQMINNVIRSWLMLHVTTRISISLIADFLSKLMQLPIAFFNSKNIGDIMQRIRDNSRIETFLTGALISTALSAVSFLIYIIVIASYSVNILIVFFIGSAIYITWIVAFMKRRRKLDYMQFQQLAKNQSSLIQLVDGMQEIKLNNCERAKRWEWEKIQARLFQISTKSMNLSNLQNTGGNMIDQIKNILITFLSAKAVIDGNMTIGGLVALQYIIGQLNAPLYQFIAFLQSLQDARISLERMGEIQNMDNEEEIKDYSSKLISNEASIIFKNVTFQYDGPRSPKVIDNLSITIPANKTTAIVGVSGSGKTTILKLLLRFSDPVSGEILLGGQNLSNYNIREWRRNCGVVMQDGYIFSDTIMNNIGVSDENVDSERVVFAAQQACISDFIESLPMGYNTKIGSDGHGLSSGQKQRILISRAIYKNAQYILFDEATNSLDANNEKNIMENLEKFFEGKTVIIVAHRLSTVKNADNIIVLAGGVIAEQGSHEELISAKDIYYNLVKNQLELGN